MELSDHLSHGGNMERYSILGFFLTVSSYLTSRIFGFLYWLGRLEVETLQEVSAYLTIIVAIMTILLHLGNMIIKRADLLRALREIIGKKRKS